MISRNFSSTVVNIPDKRHSGASAKILFAFCLGDLLVVKRGIKIGLRGQKVGFEFVLIGADYKSRISSVASYQISCLKLCPHTKLIKRDLACQG